MDTVLRCYPQIYLACHVAHPRAPSSPSGLSERAMRASSVLDAGRVDRMLARLSEPEREAALHGLALLARAARELASHESKTTWSGRGR